MNLLNTLIPENALALGIVAVLLALFSAWSMGLTGAWLRNLRCKREIERAADVSLLRSAPLRDSGTAALATEMGQVQDRAVFDEFASRKHLDVKGPIARHLLAIFEASRSESQLDISGLLKNTNDQLLRGNAWLRPVLSTFIIIGLLGTLVGLADALGSLDVGLQRNGSTLEDAVVATLKPLLRSLKSAFAPSILGVGLTLLGVLLFAGYVRFVLMPLGSLLERMTLTIWAPQLMPTPSNRMLEHLQIGERQVHRSFEAAQRVAEFAEGLSSKTTVLDQALAQASSQLQQMAQTAGTLQSFSENFIAGVQQLVPFQQELRALYEQTSAQSQLFQRGVETSLKTSLALQQHVESLLQSQQQQVTQLLASLHSYEAAYLRSREQIDAKLELVLEQASGAFASLGQRNEEIGAALDGSLGKPLRENLAENLGGVQAALLQRLDELRQATDVQLAAVVKGLGALDGPINVAARNFSDTFINFNERATGWFESLQREFAAQNETNQQRLQHLVSLGEKAPELLLTLEQTGRVFTDSSGSFASQGQKLGEDVSKLSSSVDALAEKVSRSVDTPHHMRVVELLQLQLNALQHLGRPGHAPLPHRSAHSWWHFKRWIGGGR